MSVIKEFKAFAMKGNVMDLAVGVIIGAAFGKIVGALVDNLLMPVLGMMLQGINFQELSIKVGEAQIKYGLFIAAIVDFIIIAFVLFLIIKAMNNMVRKEAAEPAPPPVPTKDQVLLGEIRDILKNRQ